MPEEYAENNFYARFENPQLSLLQRNALLDKDLCQIKSLHGAYKEGQDLVTVPARRVFGGQFTILTAAVTTVDRETHSTSWWGDC